MRQIFRINLSSLRESHFKIPKAPPFLERTEKSISILNQKFPYSCKVITPSFLVLNIFTRQLNHISSRTRISTIIVLLVVLTRRMNLLEVVIPTIYLSWLIHSEDVLGREVHTCEHQKFLASHVRKHKEINNVEHYTALDIYLDLRCLGKRKLPLKYQGIIWKVRVRVQLPLLLSVL